MQDLERELELLKAEHKAARFKEHFSRKDPVEHKKAKEELDIVLYKLKKLKMKIYEERNGMKK